MVHRSFGGRSMSRRERQQKFLAWGAVWFTALTGLVWLGLSILAWLASGRAGAVPPKTWVEVVFGPSLAATVCLVSGWLVFALAARYSLAASEKSDGDSRAIAEGNPLLLVLAGWGIRFAGVGLAVAVALVTPLAKDNLFWLSLAVLYGVTLTLETFVIRRLVDVQ